MEKKCSLLQMMESRLLTWFPVTLWWGQKFISPIRMKFPACPLTPQHEEKVGAPCYSLARVEVYARIHTAGRGGATVEW